MHDSAVVIVGAGQGLGRALALALAEQGANLFLVSLTQHHLEKTAALAGEFGGVVRYRSADASDPGAVQVFMDDAIRAFGRIDVLVNCQGKAQIAHLDAITNAEWDEVIAQNLSSVFYTCRSAFAQMKRQEMGGDIVNIGSHASLLGARQALGYLSAKAGVVGLGRALMREGKDFGIRISTICPGAMDTPMRWAASPEMDRDALLDPSEVANIILTLLKQPSVYFEDPIVPVLG